HEAPRIFNGRERRLTGSLFVSTTQKTPRPSRGGPCALRRLETTCLERLQVGREIVDLGRAQRAGLTVLVARVAEQTVFDADRRAVVQVRRAAREALERRNVEAARHHEAVVRVLELVVRDHGADVLEAVVGQPGARVAGAALGLLE